MAPGSLALLAVLCGLLGALAQEPTPPADGAAGEPPEQQAAPLATEEQETTDEAEAGAASPQSFADSAKELKDKLAQLKALLDKRGDTGDPALKERLEGLTKQLSSLGLDSFSEGKQAAEKQLMTACISMSIKRVGLKRSAAMFSLRRLASGKMTSKEASEDQLMRTVAVCLNELSDAEYKQFTAGKLDTLPKAYADKAASAASKAEVLALEGEYPGIWEQLSSAAGPVLKPLEEAAAKEAPPIPIRYGLLAGVPILLIMAFLGKKFIDMQRDLKLKEELRKEKAAKKKGK